MSIETQIREVVKEVVRDELRSALRESVTALVAPPRADEGGYLTVSQAARSAGVHEATIQKRKGRVN